MLKKVSILLAVIVSVSLFTACGAKPTIADSNKISVVSTIFAPYDFAREIAGDNAEITMLLPPGSESHSYEPTPQDIIKIQECDVFIYVGGDSDEWVHEIIESIDVSDKQVITLMDCVETVPEEIVEGMQEEDEEHGEIFEIEYDEHVWASPRNAKLIVQKISDAMQKEDSANAAVYAENTSNYLAKLDALDKEFQTVVDSGVRKEILMGDRFPFRYFADAYGLEYYAAFVGCSTETEASAATIAFLIDKTANDNLPVVFHIELSNEKIANTVAEGAAEKTGKAVKVLLLHACHNVTKAELEGGATYLSLMEQNVTNLKEALS
jgi:zinc transport system substrate-binding protein